MVRQSQKPLFGLALRDMEHVCAGAAADLEMFRGKSLFLTGGTGFFGKWILAALFHAEATLELGLRVTVLSRDPAKFLAQYPELKERPGIRFMTGDITSFDLWAETFDYVIHAATDTLDISTPEQEEVRTRAIEVGTWRALYLAKDGGSQRMLNISSGAVYGAAAGKPSGASEEDYATAVPLTSYAKAKREAEQLCVESKVDVVTARAFAFLGPHLPLDAHYAAGNFLRDALKGGPIVVRGDGTALRSYLYPADLVIWLLRILRQGKRGHAYNVGSDEAVTTAELARLMANGKEVVIQSQQPHGPQNIYLPRIDRARTELGLEVKIPLKEAIARTLEFLR